MKNYIVNIVNIEYDIDELEDGEEMPVLPTFLSMDVSVVSDEVSVSEAISKAASYHISNKTGFCHKSFGFEYALIG